jgi:hypothetical protein
LTSTISTNDYTPSLSALGWPLWLIVSLALPW